MHIALITMKPLITSGDHPMQIQLILSARDVKLNDSEFKNNWPE